MWLYCFIWAFFFLTESLSDYSNQQEGNHGNGENMTLLQLYHVLLSNLYLFQVIQPTYISAFLFVKHPSFAILNLA